MVTSSKIEMTVPDDEIVKQLADYMFAELDNLEFVERRLLHPLSHRDLEFVYVFIPRRFPEFQQRNSPKICASYVEGRLVVRLRNIVNQFAAEMIRSLVRESGEYASSSVDAQTQKRKLGESTMSSGVSQTRKRKLKESASTSSVSKTRKRKLKKSNSYSGVSQTRKRKSGESTTSIGDSQTRKRKLGEVVSSTPPAAKVRRKNDAIPERAL